MRKTKNILTLSFLTLSLITLSSCGEYENIYSFDKLSRLTEATILNANGQRINLNTAMDINEIKDIVHTLPTVDYSDYYNRCYLDTCGTKNNLKHKISVEFGYHQEESSSLTKTYSYNEVSYSKYTYERSIYNETITDISNKRLDFSCIINSTNEDEILAYEGAESYEDYQDRNNNTKDIYRYNNLVTTTEKDSELNLSSYLSDCFYVYNTTILDDILEANSSDNSQTYSFTPTLSYYLTERDLVYCVNRDDGIGFSDINFLNGVYGRNSKGLIDEIYKNYQNKKYHYNFKYYFNLETGKLEDIDCDIYSPYTSKRIGEAYSLVGSFIFAASNAVVDTAVVAFINALRSNGEKVK